MPPWRFVALFDWRWIWEKFYFHGDGGEDKKKSIYSYISKVDLYIEFIYKNNLLYL
jgi:hypothetical protein